MVFAPQQIFSNATTTLPDGSPTPFWLPAVYNGPVDDTLQLQGFGVYVSREYTYEGNFKDGRNHGWGKMVSKCGEMYEGFWKEGRRHGLGVVIQVCGKRLEGEWVRDVLQGIGAMQMADGLRYEGQWLNGSLDGWGILSKNNRLLAVGQFIAGKPNGWMRCRSSYCSESINATNQITTVLSQQEETQTFHFCQTLDIQNSDNLEESHLDDSEIWDCIDSDLLLDIPDVDFEFEPLVPKKFSPLPLRREKLSLKKNSLFESLNGKAGWRDVWKYPLDFDESHGPALKMLKRPQKASEVLLFNSALMIQGPGLKAHIRDRTNPSTAEPSVMLHLEIPTWLDDLLSNLDLT